MSAPWRWSLIWAARGIWATAGFPSGARPRTSRRACPFHGTRLVGRSGMSSKRGISRMADHPAHGKAPSGGLEAHLQTYEGFLRGAVAVALMVFFTMVALVSFRFGHSLNTFIGFAVLVIGLIVVLIDLKAGSRWFLSLGTLIVLGLITAVNVS